LTCLPQAGTKKEGKKVQEEKKTCLPQAGSANASDLSVRQAGTIFFDSVRVEPIN